MSFPWSRLLLSRESFEPVNLIPIMNSPLKSPKLETNSLESSQQQQSHQQRTLRSVVPPAQRYHPGVPVHTTYIHSLNLSFSQPGSYNISVNLSGEVSMAPEAAAQAAAIMAKPTKPATDGTPSQRTRSPRPTAKVEEDLATLPTSELDLFGMKIDNPFGTGTPTQGTFY